MSYILHYSLKCDACRKVHKYNFDSKKDLLENAKGNGWASSAGKHFCVFCAVSVAEKASKKNKEKKRIKENAVKKIDENQQRMNILISMRSRGETYSAIGDKIGVSSSRAAQLTAQGHTIMARQAKIKIPLNLIGSAKSIKSLLFSGFEPKLPARGN